MRKGHCIRLGHRDRDRLCDRHRDGSIHCDGDRSDHGNRDRLRHCHRYRARDGHWVRNRDRDSYGSVNSHRYGSRDGNWYLTCNGVHLDIRGPYSDTADSQIDACVAEIKKANGNTTSMATIHHIQQSSAFLLLCWFAGTAYGNRKAENQHADLKYKIKQMGKTLLKQISKSQKMKFLISLRLFEDWRPCSNNYT
jgi:hypothetical protein